MLVKGLSGSLTNLLRTDNIMQNWISYNEKPSNTSCLFHLLHGTELKA